MPSLRGRTPWAAAGTFALGNVTAAVIAMTFGQLVKMGVPRARLAVDLLVGILPALLAVVVIRKLKEPERWQKAVARADSGKKAGSLTELFGTPAGARTQFWGMMLAASGVIGLWGIGFFSIDLNQSVFREKLSSTRALQARGRTGPQFVRWSSRRPKYLAAARGEGRAPRTCSSRKSRTREPQAVFGAGKSRAARRAERRGRPTAVRRPRWTQGLEGPEPQAADDRDRRAAYLGGAAHGLAGLRTRRADITERQPTINGEVGFWGSITSMLFNLGGVLRRLHLQPRHPADRPPAHVRDLLRRGHVSHGGRLPVHGQPAEVFWMVPLMGFCQLSVFGGYAIYFPELFPTRLRSTGTSFCYNIGRFVAAPGRRRSGCSPASSTPTRPSRCATPA